MLVALYENGLFVDDEFREGNVPPATGHVAVYRRVEQPGKRIARCREDIASYKTELINALEEDGVEMDHHSGQEPRRDEPDRPDQGKRLEALPPGLPGRGRGHRDRTTCDGGHEPRVLPDGEVGPPP